jgi:hypothetical protein
MPVSPKDLLTFAESAAPGCDEATSRSALSRAYYAAYHALLEHLQQFPEESASASEHLGHREAWRRLKNWRVPTAYESVGNMKASAKRVALDYKAALDARALADYELGSSVSNSEVQAQCRRVRAVFTFANQVELQMQRKAG